MSTTTDLVALTADQVKALRNADSVTFHYRDESAFIVARRDIDPGDGFGKRELSVEIPVERARFTIYERTGVSGRREPTNAFWSVGSAKFNEHWPTVARFLRAGDVVQLHWTGGNSTERLRDLGFTSNHFTFVVVRPTGKDRRMVEHRFELGYETVPAGNDFTLKY